MSETYKVALIGCGGRAKEHVPALKADRRAQVVALSDIKREAAEAMNAETGFNAAVYSDHQQMLAEAKPDVVIACLWTGLHRPVFEDCVEAGVRAVLSEKPMAPTWGDCRAMGELADKTGTILTLCHQRRFAPGNIAARTLIEAGTFGKITRMDLTSPSNLLDCGTHTLDQALSFNGETPVKWALGAVNGAERLNWFGVPSEALAVGTLVFENGVRATIQCGGPDLDLWGGVRLHGELGFLEVTWDGALSGRVYDDPAWRPPAVEADPGVEMRRVVSDALDCLETGAEPVLSYKKALRAEEPLFALYESVRRRARVDLPLTGVDDNPFISLLEAGAFPA